MYETNIQKRKKKKRQSTIMQKSVKLNEKRKTKQNKGLNKQKKRNK